MGSKAEKDRLKAIQDRCQQILNEMLRDEDNKYCVDCDAKGPRWASWNLGIFLCIRCAGIHRNLGVHISKVKSVNLDSWTPEQVVSLQQMGNSRARAVYEANLPDNFRRPQTDSPLEAFIRAKYEQKKYIAREWVPPTIPKVNWDKEIEEEEQARRRKKESKSSTPQSARAYNASPGGHSLTSEIPAPLPKPKSSASPKLPRTSATTTPTPASKTTPITSSGTLDLLALDTPTGSSSSPNKGDDIFSGFLSAPPPSGASASVSPGNITAPPEATGNENESNSADSKRSAEEDSFFNQPAESVQEKKQLTKDSILALYSSVPSTGASPQTQTQSFGGIQGTVFPAQGQAQAVAGFGSMSANGMGMNFPMSNGMILGQTMSTGNNSTQNGMFASVGSQPGMMVAGGPGPAAAAAPVGMPNMSSNPFYNLSNAVPSQNAFPLPNQMTQEHGNSNDLLDLVGVSGPASLTQLPQQMNMLNIGGPSMNAANMFSAVPSGAALGQQSSGMGLGMGMGMPSASSSSSGNPWASATGVMGVPQSSFPPGQAPLGHTLATNLWQ